MNILRRLSRSLLATLAIGVLGWTTSSQAVVLRTQTAALVPVTSTWGFNPALTTHTRGVAWTGGVSPEIVELSRALSRGGACTDSCYASQVYQYVRNNIAVEFRFGLGKGGRGALVDQSGTPFDQAELMFLLLRQAGIHATYQLGTISMDATQFLQWTGMTNAAGACQYLADGGIPASVNGATSCSSVSGSVSSVVLAHLWVSALGNLYDPSYKIHVVKTGIGTAALAAKLGCDLTPCETAAISFVPGPTPSGIPGVDQIQSVNQSGLEQQLQTYAGKLQTYIQDWNTSNYTSDNPNMQVEDLLGGVVIDTSQKIPPAPTVSAFTGTYTPSSSYLLAMDQDIPDQFRTTITVQFGAINQLLYADETAGSRLRLLNLAVDPGATNPILQSGLYSESMLLASKPFPNPTGAAMPLTLLIRHPYANNSGGSYLNESLSFTVKALLNTGSTCSLCAVWHATQVTIIQGLGHTSESTVSHYSALVQRDETHQPQASLSPQQNQNPPLQDSDIVWPRDPFQAGVCFNGVRTPTPSQAPGCFEKHQATIAANWLAQSSRLLALIAAVNGTVLQEHDNFGLAVSGRPMGQNLMISLQPDVSFDVNASTATSVDTTAAYYSGAALLSRLEGSILEQTGNIWEGGAAVSMMTRSNYNNIAFFDITPQNGAAAASAATNGGLLGSYVGTGGSFYADQIQPYINQQAEVILPQQATAGTVASNPQNHLTFIANGFAVYGANGSHVTYGTNDLDHDKGAGGPSDPIGLVAQQTTIREYAAKKRSLLTIEPSTGEVSLMPSPDLVTGSGEFPASLAFQRVYNSGGQGYICPDLWHRCYRAAAEISALPMGWTHTLAITARLTSDGLASMGRNSALDASAAIAALYTARQLNIGTRNFKSKLATIFVANWMGSNLSANVVAVRRPPSIAAFVRLPDGTHFNPPPGNSEVLTQSGLRVAAYAGYNVWANSALSFTLTTKNREVLSFEYGVETAVTPIPDIATSGIFHAKQWQFPNGINISFGYSASGVGEHAACLTSVSNNLGRSLTFADMCDKSQTSPPAAQTVTDDASRSVSITLVPAWSRYQWGPQGSYFPFSSGSLLSSDFINNTTLLVKAPDQIATSQYDYVPAPSGAINRAYYKLSSWRTPGDVNNPYQTVNYDSLYRASSVKDNASTSCCSTTYWLTGLYGSENQKVAQIVDPVLALTTKYLDRWGSLSLVIDPLGRTTSYTFDTFQRKIRETLPEGNGSSYQYDVRHNLKLTTRNPKPGSGLNASSESTSYVIGPTVSASDDTCKNSASCNKPYQVQDANGTITTYSWDSNYGLVTNIQYPPVPTALGNTGLQSPNTAFTYTPCPYTGGAGAPRLLFTKTERVWQGPTPAAQNLTTLYNYDQDPSHKCVLWKSTVDTGGKSLTTIYTFDNGVIGPGNLTAIQDPNGNSTSYVYDNLRRLIEVDRPLGSQTLYTYDLDGQLTSTRNRDAARSAYQTELRGYWPTGDLAYLIGANANPTAPAQGQSTTLAAGSAAPCPGNFVTCYQYDAVGRRVLEQIPLTATTSRLTSTVYDLAGQVLCQFWGWNQTQAAGSTDCTGWNPQNYTGSGPVRYSFLPSSGSFVNGYAVSGHSLNGKVTAVVDANGNVTTNVYDGFDRLSQMILPGATSGSSATCHTPWAPGDNCEVYGYDSDDNLQSKRNRSGKSVAISYDALNREWQRIVPNNVQNHFTRTVQKTYDLLGHAITASVTGADTQTITYTYDTAMRVQSVQDSLLGIVSYGHDNNGNRSLITWPGNSYNVSFGYDALNRLCKVREGTTVPDCTTSDTAATNLAAYSWDTLSRRQGITFQNGVTEAWTYYNDSTINTLNHVIGSKSIGINLGRNQADQIATQGLTVTDSSNSMTAASFLGTAAQPSAVYFPNSLNQYTSVSPSFTASYDLNGNLTTDGSYTYEYDEENRLRSATGPNTIVYKYDALGRRQSTSINSTVTQYLSDDQEEIAEYTGSGAPLRYYVNGAAVDEHLVQVEAGGAHYFYSTNHQGSVLVSTDGSGNTTTYSYGPYGESSTAVTGAAFRYTGRRLDEKTGLYYYRARYYSPTLGRFLQTDPIGTGDDLNLYAYVGNDPLGKTDPTGEWCIFGVIGTTCQADPLPTVTVTARRPNSGSSKTALAGFAAAGVATSEVGVGDLILVGVGIVATVDALKNSHHAHNESSESQGDVIDDLSKGGEDKGGHTEVDHRGGDQNGDFERLAKSSGNTPRPINTSYGPGKVVDLKGGGTASTRPGSSTGPGTIQINRPDGTTIKIRY